MHPTLAAQAELQHKEGLRKLKLLGHLSPLWPRCRCCRQNIKSSKLYGNIHLAKIDAVAVETTVVAYVFKLSAGR
jgi:hypothetical protein